MIDWFLLVFLFFFASYFLVEIGLDLLNISYVRKHSGYIPELFHGIYSYEDYLKSIKYTEAKTNFRLITLVIQGAFLLLLIFGKFFGRLDILFKEFLPNSLFIRAVLYPFAVALVFYIISFPQKIYFQFVIEEKFGFNRMDKKTFLLDQIKTLFLTILFGLPLIAILLYIMDMAKNWWWILGASLVMGFNIFIAAIYPVFLAPLFNKFTPLSEGTLKDRIESLAKKVGFKMAGIFVIDGSKRSSHSNAFFAGMGSMRRIVLFDTLINKHSEDEILAVIAHEMGHNVKRHIERTLAISFVMTLGLFYLLSLCLKWPLFFSTLGAYEPSDHVGLVLFFVFSSIFMFPVTPIFTALSRKHEFEADEFSIEVTKEKQSLINALVKLTKENLGNLTPHKLYSAYHYSHPTTIERVRAIEEHKI